MSLETYFENKVVYGNVQSTFVAIGSSGNKNNYQSSLVDVFPIKIKYINTPGGPLKEGDGGSDAF